MEVSLLGIGMEKCSAHDIGTLREFLRGGLQGFPCSSRQSIFPTKAKGARGHAGSGICSSIKEAS